MGGRGYPLPSRTKGEGGDPLSQAQQGGGVPPTPSPHFGFSGSRDPPVPVNFLKIPKKRAQAPAGAVTFPVLLPATDVATDAGIAATTSRAP